LTKTPVLVLHRYPFRDSSWIVKVLSPERGVMGLLVRGARRKDSSFKVAFDPLSITELVYSHSPRRDLQYPREANILEYHHVLRGDLGSQALAYTLCELLMKVGDFEGHSQDEFNLGVSALNWLNGGDQPHWGRPYVAEQLLVLMVWNLLQTLGFAMRMDECVHCQQPHTQMPADVWPAMGGAICSNCLGDSQPAWPYTVVQSVWKLSRQESLKCDGPQLAHLEQALLHYLSLHAQKKLNLKSYEHLLSMRSMLSTTFSLNKRSNEF